MNADDHDQQLRERYQALRRQEARQVPPFSRLVDGTSGTRTSTAGPPRRWVGLGMAAALLLGLGVALAFLPRRSNQPAAAPTSWATLPEWRATTDALLEMPNLPWANQGETVTDAWTDAGDPTVNAAIE